MSIAKIINPGKVKCRLEFEMSLDDWKQIRKTLNTNPAWSAECQIMDDIDDLVRQLEATLWSKANE